jgi:putative ubiquitin-RnfH superfamily antitoxin RatB of RatAB toxin-antitoxin module
MRVEVLMAWPGRFASVQVDLPDGSQVADALDAADMGHVDGVVGYAVFGAVATATTVLQAGDRVELLRPLQADPKDARRRRAESRIKSR